MVSRNNNHILLFMLNIFKIHFFNITHNININYFFYRFLLYNNFHIILNNNSHYILMSIFHYMIYYKYNLYHMNNHYV